MGQHFCSCNQALLNIPCSDYFYVFILKQVSNHLVHLLSFEADIPYHITFYHESFTDNSGEMMQVDGLQNPEIYFCTSCI